MSNNENTQYPVARLCERLHKSKEQFRRYFSSMKKSEVQRLDLRVHQLHNDICGRIDCLSCANCCRTLGPRITDRDIDRIADALRVRPADVVVRYLHIDEEGDYIFRSMPCPFLGSDNYCAIYLSRPKACREYPHTDRKKFYQLRHLTIKNAETCPIALTLLEELVP